MLRLAFGLLCAAAALGGGLAAGYLRRSGSRPLPVLLPIAHGLLGAASLAALGLASWRGIPPTAMGTGGFGPIACALLALALALGFLLAGAAWRRRRPAGALVGTHAGLAIAALVMLLALVALG